MTPYHCEREQEILDAISLAEMDTELQRHARECPVCSEVHAVAASLKEASVLSAREYELLAPSDLVWKRTQEQARRLSVTKALRPIQFMTAFAIFALACLPLSAGLSTFIRSWIAMWSRFVNEPSFALSGSLSAYIQPEVLLGSSSMLLFLSLSSWYLLRTE